MISSRQNSSGLTGFTGTGLIFSNVTGFGCSTTVVVVVAGAGATKLGCIEVVTGCSCTVLGICRWRVRFIIWYYKINRLSKRYCKTYLHGLVDGAQNTVVVGLRLVAAGAGGEGGHGDGQGAAAAHPAIVVVA